MVSNADLTLLASNSNSEPCAITARIAPSTSPCARSWPWVACVYNVSSTGRAVVVEVDDDLRFGRDLHVAVKFAAGSERRRIRCAFGQGFRLHWSFEKTLAARGAHQERARVRRAGCSARGFRWRPAAPVR